MATCPVLRLGNAVCVQKYRLESIIFTIYYPLLNMLNLGINSIWLI